MRDDFLIPNLGEGPKEYDKKYIDRLVRNVEMTLRLIRSEGPINVTTLNADSLETDTLTITGLGNGLVAHTGSGAYAARTITGPAAGITVTNGSGVAGNPTLALANDLAALEGLGSTGIAARTAADTWAQRTITGTANKITVTNGDGVAGNPTITIPDAVTLVTPTVTGTATFNGDMVSNAGISFGSTTAASVTDLSSHIALWGTSYGLSITASQLNYNVATNTDHVFYHNGTEVMRIDTSADTVSAGIFQFNASTGAIQSGASGTNFDQIFHDDSVNTWYIVSDAASNRDTTNTTAILAISKLKFPATQAASSDANTLDDYEEGSWTPDITFTTMGDFSVAYSRQVGRYIKVGKTVTVWAHLVTSTFTHTTASGELRITGLPFTSANNSAMETTGSCETSAVTVWGGAGYTQINSNIVVSTTYVRLVGSQAGVNRSSVQANDTTSGTNITVILQITYEATN